MSRTYKSETLQALADGWYIEADSRILPMLTGYRIGVAGAVVASRDEAEKLLSPEGQNLLAAHSDARAIQVSDPWALMRRAAGEGLCGFQMIAAGEWSHRFIFMVRVEEAGNDLPTVLTSIHLDTGWSTSLTRTREASIDHAEVLHWERFDILDAVSGTAGQACPFRDWEDGDVLFEIRTDSVVVLIANVHLLGPWNSPEGAFAFFTSADKAEHYLSHHLGDGRNRMVLLGSDTPESPEAAFASLAVRPVTDLQARLRELAQVAPIAAWCVNPDGHREDSGYGRLAFGGEHPAALAAEGVAEARMAAVSGLWRIASGNQFEMLVPNAPWTGFDTIRWSGGQSLQLRPLDRSFAVAGTPESIDANDLTETELADALAAYLDGQSLDDGWEALIARSTDEAPLNDFHMVWWDTVTGDRPAVPWRFDSVFRLLRQLTAYEREHDRHHREAGASSCGHIGFVGSQDATSEDLRSERFRIGVRGLAARIRRDGYRPSHAADIAALCNGVLATLHVEYVGHAKDLLWCSEQKQRELMLNELEIDEADWSAWEASAEALIDPEGRALVVAMIGEDTWNTLGPRVRHFLSTALLQLDRQGRAPQLDYAPISLEVVKALEVELGAIFADFRGRLRGVAPTHASDDRDQASLAAYLSGAPEKKPPTLGAISHFLRTPSPGASDLLVAFHSHVQSLPNAAFLLDKKFCRDGLMRVTNKFRNGGVHDSAIPEATCRECVAVLVGTPGVPGYIGRTAAWKTAPRGDLPNG